MDLVRFAKPPDFTQSLGVLDNAGLHELPEYSLPSLLGQSLRDIRGIVESADAPPIPLEGVRLLPPVDGRMEVWGAGLTYLRSRQARVEESSSADVYERVYEAERPELFFKAVPWRVVTDGEPIAIRADSELNVPEAELSIVVNALGDIVGYGVCNDVSSRSIEGVNPLYLPQAKIYAGSCALAGRIRLAWEVDVTDLEIKLTVDRHGKRKWSGSTSTAQLQRALPDLVSYLYTDEQFPDGAVISTGTGIVPEMDFSLSDGDLVTIEVDQVGRLTNPVVLGKSRFAWLAGSVAERPGRPLIPSG